MLCNNPSQRSLQQNLKSGLSIAELIELRKLRQKQRGIDAENLIKGDLTLKKKEPEVPDDPWKLKTGGLVDLNVVKGVK
jgi:hypothetical protein